MAATVYTYQEYLEAWEGSYGDETEAEAEFTMYGQRQTRTIHKLNQADLEHQVKEYNRLEGEYEKALSEGNNAGIDKALNQMFPFELRLLM